MKKHVPLTPPIDQIDRRLFGVSVGLIEAVIRGETSPGVAEAVRRSSEWTPYQADLREARIAAEQPSDAPPSPSTVPDHIKSLIERRVAANALATMPFPAPGQIVAVEKIVTPRPAQLDAIMQVPLHVLLDAPAEAPALWHGWLVSAETDYAGWWDFVLQEQDAPFDPEAAMVQVWNPVRLYLPMAARVVGCISPSRLQALRALAADFAVEEAPSDIPSWPGRVASRSTSQSLRVSTGSPLGGDEDARHRYQELYFAAAEAVGEPARLALSALAEIPASQAGTLLNRLIAAAGRMAEILLPEPRVAVAMNGEDAVGAPDLFWPDMARMRIDGLTAEGDGRMELTAIGAEPLIVEVRRGTLVEECVTIAAGGVDSIAWDKDSTGVVLSTASGRRLELALKDQD